MRYPIAAALSIVMISGFPAATAAPCEGAACGSLKLGADGCSWTNAGDKSVRLAVNRADGGAPLVTVLAPGEQFKAQAENCSKSATDGVHYEASFPVLKVMPDEAAGATKISIPLPRAKPALPVSVAATSPLLPASSPALAATIPLPRVKPMLAASSQPLPRPKPEMPVAAAPALTAPSAPVMPDVSAASVGSSGCGDACGEILFKEVDSCIWVQNQNPRPISFDASIKGKSAKLLLEGANGAKADVRASVLAKAGADAGKADAAYHTRVRDPFQSAGAGIPVYRVRLEVAGSCVKGRDEISAFAARFVN
jgi:hypothetical protein